MLGLSLIEESEDLATSPLPSGLVVLDNAVSGGEDDVTEATGGENVLDPLLNVGHGHVEAGGDDAALVDPANELDDNLAGAVVVNDLKLANVAALLHHLQKLDHHLGRRPDNNLPLPPLLRVGDGLQAVCQHRHLRHLACG